MLQHGREPGSAKDLQSTAIMDKLTPECVQFLAVNTPEGRVVTTLLVVLEAYSEEKVETQLGLTGAGDVPAGQAVQFEGGGNATLTIKKNHKEVRGKGTVLGFCARLRAARQCYQDHA